MRKIRTEDKDEEDADLTSEEIHELPTLNLLSRV